MGVSPARLATVWTKAAVSVVGPATGAAHPPKNTEALLTGPGMAAHMIHSAAFAGTLRCR